MAASSPPAEPRRARIDLVMATRPYGLAYIAILPTRHHPDPLTTVSRTGQAPDPRYVTNETGAPVPLPQRGNPRLGVASTTQGAHRGAPPPKPPQQPTRCRSW